MSQNEIIGSLELEFLINNPAVLRALQEMEGNFQNANNTIQQKLNQSASSIEDFARNAALAAGSYFSLQAAKNFVTELINVRGEFEQLNIAYQTILKSKEKGDALFAETVKLAATTPFTLTEVAQSTKQLLAYGFGAKEVTDVLTTLGNVAAGVSAPIGDIAYLYGTLKTQGRAYAQDIRQFTGRGIPIIAELAKQFGVTNEQVNKLVEEGKVGFPEIEKAFKSLTGPAGIFYNLMEKQSKTLTGQLSNLSDAFSQMLNEIGKGDENILNGGIAAAASIVANYKSILDIIEELIIAYGVYKAVIITNTAITALQTSGMLAFTAAQLLQYGALSALTAAQVALNSAQAVGVINAGAITAAITILIFSVRSLVTEYEHMHIAEKQITEIRADGLKGIQDEKLKISDLVTIIKDHNISQEQRAKAIKKLNELNPEFLGGLNEQNILTKQGTEAIDKYLDALEHKLQGEAAYSAKLENVKKINDVKTRGYDALSTTEEAGAILSDFFSGGILKGTDGKKRVLDDYMKALEDANKRIDEQYKKVLTNRSIGDTTPTDSKELQRLKKFAEDIKEPVKNFNDLLKLANGKTELDAIDKALKEKLDHFLPNSQQQAEIKQKLTSVKKLLDTYSLSADKKASGEANSEQLRRNKIFDDIAKLKEEQYQNSLTSDQKDIEREKAKYEKILKEIDKFNNDPRNKGRIDPKKTSGVVNGIKKDQQDAVDIVTAKQSVEKQKSAIEQQKMLFDGFEKYKLEAGETAANELYGKDLKGYKNYLEYLNSLKPDTSDVSAKANATRDLLSKLIPDAENEQAKKAIEQLASLLIQTQSFEEKRAVITELYSAKRAKLVEENRNDEVKTLDTQYQEELETLQSGQADKIASMQRYSDNVLQLTASQAKTQIKTLREIQKSSNLTPGQNTAIDTNIAQLQSALTTVSGLSGKYITDLKIQKEQLEAQLKVLTPYSAKWTEVFNKITGINVLLDHKIPADKFGEVANYAGVAAEAFSQIAAATHDTNPQLSETAVKLSQVAGIAQNAVKAVTSYFEADYASMITSIIGLVTSAIAFFSDSEGKARQLALTTELQQKAVEAVNKALERQISLTKQLYGVDRITGYIKALNDLAQAQKDAQAQINGKYALTDNDSVNKLIKAYNDGTINDFDRRLLEDVKNAGVLVSLAGKSLEDLQKLLDSGKLDDITSALVQNLVSIKQQIIDTQNALKADVTGTEFDSLADSIVQLFKEGKTATADFADNFKNLMQDAILKAFKTKYLETQLQGFYDQFAAAFQSGAADAATIAKLQAAYDDIIKKAQAEFTALQGITGQPFDSSSTTNNLVGAIKGMTSDEAGILEGTMHAMQLSLLDSNNYLKDSNNTQKAQLAEMRAQTLIQKDIAANTKRTADSIDNDVTPALNKIANNTSGSLSADLRAAGHFGY